MLRSIVRIFGIFLLVCAGSARAEESCDALGHLLLASDLMRIAAQAGGDLNTTYGPSIGASLESSADLPADFRRRRPDRVSALQGLRSVAANAFAFVVSGQAEPSVLEEAGTTVARDGQQLYVDWTCDDPEPGDGSGELTGGDDDASEARGGAGEGRGGMTFRAVWISLGNQNRLERAVLLGCFSTASILLPYLLWRDRRNRRRAERYPCTLPTRIMIASVETEAIYFDISVTGARLTLPVVLAPGTELSLEVGGEMVLAHVVRSGKGYAGVEFASTLSQAQIDAVLAEIAKANSWAARYGGSPDTAGQSKDGTDATPKAAKSPAPASDPAMS